MKSSLSSIMPAVQSYKKNQQTIVLVTGVFDVLHSAHINFLKAANESADILIIAIESDVRVKQIKGQGRPINSHETRTAQLEDLKIAAHIIILPQNFSHPSEHQAFISTLAPDVLAVSSHTHHLEKKRNIVEEHGGKVVIVYPHKPHISSSAIIEQSSN